MDLALMIAKSGLDAHHKNIEIISNNLANSNTAAFKKNRAEFTDLPYKIESQPGALITEGTTTSPGLVIGTGTRLQNNKKIFSDGSPILTGNPLDINIKGRGFLQVQLPNGSEMAYTRDGRLGINEQGQLIASNGYVIQPPMTIPTGSTNLSISQDGIVSVITGTSNTPQQIGQLQLADFINPDGLQPIGDNLYISSGSSGTVTLANPGQVGYGTIAQSQYEGSNVNVVEEMVNLIEAQRAFEVTSKAVSAVDQMLQIISRTN